VTVLKVTLVYVKSVAADIHSCVFAIRELPYIVESNPHPNLIRSSFCRFLKRGKKKVSSQF